MPPVPVLQRRERAARLREAARCHAARFHAGLVGCQVAVLVERDGVGRSEHFSPVRRCVAAPARWCARASQAPMPTG